MTRAGEAPDKGARSWLSYPGGPIIDRLAQQGIRPLFRFPRTLLPGTHDFSFSGIKTALLRGVQSGSGRRVEDLAAAYQRAIVEMLVRKTMAAARETGVRQGTPGRRRGLEHGAACRDGEGVCRRGPRSMPPWPLHRQRP